MNFGLGDEMMNRWRVVFLVFVLSYAGGAHAMAWRIVSCQWRPDANPWAKQQVWEGTFWTEGWAHDEQFYPKYMKPAGSIHIILENDSARSENITLKSLNGTPISDLATNPRRSGEIVWFKVESPSLGPPDTSADRNDPRFERSDSAEVRSGGWVDCCIRLRSVPKGKVIATFETGGSGLMDVAVPIVAPRVRIETIAFSTGIDRLYVYLRSLDGKPVGKCKVLIDGHHVSARWTLGPMVSGLLLAEIDLKPAWELGSFHLIEVALQGGGTLARIIRAWDGYFCIGLYGVLEPARVADAKAHGFNTYFTGGVSPILDEAGMNYVPAHNVGEGRKRTGNVSGTLFYQNKDEPDAHDWGSGEDLPPMERLGVNAQAEVLPDLRYQRARDPGTPNLLLVDNTYKPLQWYVYGQIADIYCTDPYVPLNGRQLDYVWRALDVARDACTPSPLVSVLWACALDGKRKFGNNAPTPEEIRMAVFYALGCGVKGIAYFIDMSQKTGEGQFTGLSDIKPLWQEVGRTNRDVAILAPYLSIGCPVPGGVKVEGAWARAVMCGSDKLVVIVVNTKHYIAFETRNECSLHEVTRDVDVSIQLPPEFQCCKVEEINNGRLISMPGKVEKGALRLKLDVLDTARAVLISRLESCNN